MKNKVLSFFKITFVLSAIVLISSSCDKGNDNYYDNYYDYYYDSTVMFKDFTTIKNSEWTWNSNMSRYEYLKTINTDKNNILTQDMYNDGIIAASVFLIDGSVETQTSLPYVRTWIDNVTGDIYTETLSYDVSVQDNTILYYIQSSNLNQTDKTDFPEYQIKLAVIDQIDY